MTCQLFKGVQGASLCRIGVQGAKPLPNRSAEGEALCQEREGVPRFLFLSRAVGPQKES